MLPFKLTLDDWLITDTHWGHGNIVQYSNRPANHNELMLENWHKLVQPGERVIHLGDIAMTGPNAAPLYPQIKALPGEKFLLRGNHDSGTTSYYQSKLGFTVLPYHRPSRTRNNFKGGVIYATVTECGRDEGDCDSMLTGCCHTPECCVFRVALSHVPCWYDDGDWDINIHGHIHNNGYNPAIRDNGYGDRPYRNICVEQVGYAPVRLREVCLGQVGTTPREDGWNDADPDQRIVVT